ncbi:AraC family transcriptional regulator [Bacteroidia bacterium]|nr:AraC family transcriptional regulator [Bacteroidia bacterium]
MKTRQTALQQEMTPLSDEDFFILLDHTDAKFDYEAHWHTDYELNMVIGAEGERLVGDSHEEFDYLDIVLIGPRMPHRWISQSGEGTHVITIQFHEQMLNYPTIGKRIFASIRELLERARRGIVFAEEVRPEIRDRLLNLSRSKGFDIALQFYSLLDFMAGTPGQRLLASDNYDPGAIVNQTHSRRIGMVCDYVNKNFGRQISLSDMAELTNMSESSFCHFFKKKTGKNFIDYLHEVRIGHATRMLCETSESIAEICFVCGYNNTSNFLRVFRNKLGETPTQYRNNARRMMMTRY